MDEHHGPERAIQGNRQVTPETGKPSLRSQMGKLYQGKIQCKHGCIQRSFKNGRRVTGFEARHSCAEGERERANAQADMDQGKRGNGDRFAHTDILSLRLASAARQHLAAPLAPPGSTRGSHVAWPRKGRRWGAPDDIRESFAIHSGHWFSATALGANFSNARSGACVSRYPPGNRQQKGQRSDLEYWSH